MSEIMVQEPGRIVTDGTVPAVAWFCLRSQPKHEHIAAEHLRRMGDVEVFNPRVRFTRRTRLGPAPVTEAMFPNYLFARFDWRDALARVHYATGVSSIVHFGSRWPTVPDQAIAELRALVEADGGVRVLQNGPAVGDLVELRGQGVGGLQAVVARVLPGKDRVLVLMDFLGRQTMVDVGLNSIVRHGFER